MFITDATHLQQHMNCNGSRLLPDTERAPDTDTTLRDEGNAAHWLAQECFEGRIDVNKPRDDLKANNGVLVTVFMFAHVREYLLNLYPGQMEITTNHGVPNVWQINGRADHIGFDSEADELWIDDFKYGYSIVEPFMNWTLISHAVGWCKAWNHWPARIRLVIHQPRPYHPNGNRREWVITGEQLLQLASQIDAAMTKPNDELHTGNHCFKCSKNGNCPAFRGASMNSIDVLEHAFSDQLSDEALASEYKLMEYASKVIKYRMEALNDMAKHRVQQGKVLPGLALERTYSNTTWRKNITPETAKVLTGKDLSKPKMVTPSEAKAMGVPELILRSMTNRIETGVKLVSFDPNAKMAKYTKQ